MFNLVADLLAWFYSLWPSYGGAIILLTLLVMIVLTPLNVKSTRSMLEMRRLQPEIKRLQAEHGGDRVKLNEEMMKLYQEHNVNPVGGCLPLFIQLPIFFVLFRLLQGLTRRSSEIGFVAGSAVGQSAATSAGPGGGGGLEAVQLPKDFETFNPQYLDTGSELFADLSSSTEMNFLSIDLSESASSALRESFSHGLPFLGMVILVFGLSLIQQRQIAGRNQGEIPQQQKMLMWILPFMLPVFSFAMPAGLVVYFITQSLIRIGQQAFITRRVYRPMQDLEPIEVKAVEKASTPAADAAGADSGGPKGLLDGILGGQQGARPAADEGRRHGRRRPTNAPPSKPKRKPPSGNRQGRTSPPRSSDTSKAAKAEPTPKEGRGLFGGARRAAAEEPKKTTEPKRPSSRVTPKGEQSRSNNRKKRKKR
jgi:YidC/Oxa1 family membrane protein insertase